MCYQVPHMVGTAAVALGGRNLTKDRGGGMMDPCYHQSTHKARECKDDVTKRATYTQDPEKNLQGKGASAIIIW